MRATRVARGYDPKHRRMMFDVCGVVGWGNRRQATTSSPTDGPPRIDEGE